jgi:hypothetical protein
MAEYTANKGSFIRPYRAGANTPMIRYFECSTTASTTACIRTGDIVQFDTCAAATTCAHRIVVAQSTGGTGANLLGINGASLVGVAVECDESDGSTKGAGPNRKVGVAIFDRQTEFIAYTRWAGPVTSTLIGQARSIIRDSTNRIWQVDSTNSTTALMTCVITDVPYESIGDTGSQVVFQISPTSLVSQAIRP